MTFDIIATRHTKKNRLPLLSQRSSLTRARAYADELCARGWDVQVRDEQGRTVYQCLGRLTLITGKETTT